jgi:hypothetical protein
MLPVILAAFFIVSFVFEKTAYAWWYETTANPDGCSWSRSTGTITVASDHHQVYQWINHNYHWSTSRLTPSVYDFTTANKTFYTSRSTQGSLYLHVKANARHFSYGTTFWTSRFGLYLIDRTAPTITADPPNRAASSANINVTVTVTDSGGSGYYRHRFAWSNHTWRPLSGWSNWIYSANSYPSQSTDGTWYLQVEAQDNATNEAYASFGTYLYQGAAGMHREHPDHAVRPVQRHQGDKLQLLDGRLFLLQRPLRAVPLRLGRRDVLLRLYDAILARPQGQRSQYIRAVLINNFNRTGGDDGLKGLVEKLAERGAYQTELLIGLQSLLKKFLSAAPDPGVPVRKGESEAERQVDPRMTQNMIEMYTILNTES